MQQVEILGVRPVEAAEACCLVELVIHDCDGEVELGEFTQKIPGMLFRLGVKDPARRHPYSLHTPMFQASESALRTGISLMAYLAIELLKIEAVDKINS